MMTNDIVIATFNKELIVTMFVSFNNEEQLSRAMKEAKNKGVNCTTMSREEADFSLRRNIPYTEYSKYHSNIDNRIEDTIEAWETGQLGADEAFAIPYNLTKEENNQIDEALDLEEVTIRLEQEVIEQYKLIATVNNINYKTAIRSIIKAYANFQAKSIIDDKQKEFCHHVVCAAVRHLSTNEIIISPRHFDTIFHNTLNLVHPDYQEGWKNAEQGFIDNFGNFLTRQEAWIIAKKANQIKYRCGGDGIKLFSENLY